MRPRAGLVRRWRGRRWKTRAPPPMLMSAHLQSPQHTPRIFISPHVGLPSSPSSLRLSPHICKGDRASRIRSRPSRPHLLKHIPHLIYILCFYHSTSAQTNQQPTFINFYDALTREPKHSNTLDTISMRF